MAYLPTNSTNTLLLANQEFIGEAVAVDKEYISVTCSFNSNVGGVLEFFHSIDGFAFSNYADIYDFTDKPGSHSIEVSVKGKYFKIRYINGNQNQGVFNLFCKLNVTVGEAILNATYDTITVYAGGENGFNTRLLTTDDKISVPRLEEVLTTDSGVSALQCKITSMPAIVIPPITIGDVNIRDSNGNDILSTTAGFLKTEIMNSSLTVNTISGFATSANQVTAQASLNSLVTGTRILSSNGNSITVDSSNNLNVNVKNTSLNVDTGLTMIHINNESLNVDTGLTMIYINNESLNVDTGLTMIHINNESLNVDTGLTMIHINNQSLNVDTGLTMIHINNETLNVDTGLTMIHINNESLNVDTGLTMIHINNETLNVDTGLTMIHINNEILNVDTGLTMIHINNETLNVDTGLTMIHINNETLNVDTGLTMIYINNESLNVDTGLTMIYINNTSLAVTGTFFPSVQSITGHVIVSSMPAITQSTNSIAVYGNDGTTNHILKTDNTGKLEVVGDFVTLINEATSTIQVYGANGTENYPIRTDTTGKLEVVVVGGITAITTSETSSVLMVGDDYSGSDPAVQNPVFVDANGFIGTNIITTTHQDIVYGFDEMVSILTAGNTAPWSKVNPVSSDENGWYTGFSGLTSLLWYNNGPYGNQQTYNYQTEFDFNKLNLWFMILKQYRPLTGSAGSPIMPTIRIFSKPTGTNDVIGGVAHSFWDYTMTAGQAINYGESIVIYSGQVNKIKLNNPEVRRIVYTSTGGGGDRGNNEIVNHIEFIYNTPNVYNTLVIEAGIFINQIGLINYYFSNGNSSKADIATIAMKTATDTINTNVGTINTTTSAINTKLTGMTYTSNRLQTQTTLVDAGGDVATISTPAQISGVSTIRGLDTQSYGNAYDVYNNQYDNLTLTNSFNPAPSVSYKALDTYVRNPLTTVDKSLFGLNNTGTYSGINMYPIQPKVKQLVMSGTTATANGILGGHNSLQTISNVNWGITQPKTFYITMNSGGAQRTFYYDYIDTNGNERTMGYTIPTPITNWYALPLQTGFTEQMVGINNVRVSSSLTVNDTYFISNTQNTGNSVCSGSYGRTYNAVITIPNNAIGYVTNVFMFNAVASNYDIWKYDNQTGARKMIYYYNTAFATNHMAAGADGSLGGYLQAGEAILGGNENANSMTVFANVVIKYLS